MTGRTLRWAGVGLIGAAVIFSVVLASRFGGDPGLVDSPLLGNPAPEFALEPLGGGDPVSHESLHGDIVVVNFFASWCLECRAEHADLVATSDAFGDQGVTFLPFTVTRSPGLRPTKVRFSI